MSKTMKLLILAAFAFTPVAASYETPRLRASYGESADSDASDALNPERAARREAKQACIQSCMDDDDTKTQNQCRIECTGNERSVGPGRVFTIAPTPTPGSREHYKCMAKCETEECRERCPVIFELTVE